MTDTDSRRRDPVFRAAAAVVVTLSAMILSLIGHAAPAAAHDATTSAYVVVTREGSDVAAEFELEYDLLLKSAWTYAEAYEAIDHGEQLRQLAANADAVESYVSERFAIDADGERCVVGSAGDADVRDRNGRAFAVLSYDVDCNGREGDTLAFSSALFPDVEGFVHDTETLVEWRLDGERGNGIVTAGSPTIELGGAPRFGEFFVLGIEHRLFGLDHALFLLALLLGARSLRGVIVTATTFTIAHSVTFLLAGMGFVSLPAMSSSR